MKNLSCSVAVLMSLIVDVRGEPCSEGNDVFNPLTCFRQIVLLWFDVVGEGYVLSSL